MNMADLYLDTENLNIYLLYMAIKEKENGCSIKIPINAGNKQYNLPHYDKHKEYVDNIVNELPPGFKLKVIYKSKLSSKYTEEESDNVTKYKINFPMEEIYAVAYIDRVGAENLYKEAERFASRVLNSHSDVMKQIYAELQEDTWIEIWSDAICGRKDIMFRDLGVKNLEKSIQKYGMAIAISILFRQCNKKQYRIDFEDNNIVVKLSNELLDW